MPSILAPFGLRPVKRGSSGYMAGRLRTYHVPASDGTALFVGDPVVTLSTGGGSTDGKYMSVTRATAGTGNYSSGVVTGINLQAGNETESALVYRAASTLRYPFVDDDPASEFEAQMNGAITLADIGRTANLVATNAGSADTGFSGWAVNATGIGTGDQVQILRLANLPNNAIGDLYPIVVVRFHKHRDKIVTAI